MDNVKIEWLGHACFRLTFGDWSCVVDPYQDGTVDGLENMQASANAVFASHGHHDHNATYLVKINKMYAPSPNIKKVITYHDDVNGAKKGENITHVFEYKGIKVAHFGDLGHILSDEQIAQIGNVDVALIPTGGFYTIDANKAKKVCEQVNAKVIIPMHYRTKEFGFDDIDYLEKFTDLCDDVVYANTCEIIVDKNTPKQTIVLTPYFMKK